VTAPDRGWVDRPHDTAAPPTRPQAYHAGIPTFMRRPMADLTGLRPGMTAVFGIPFDYTSGSRPGARWGPRGIRQSSAYFDYVLRSSPDRSYVDLETGREVRFPDDLSIVDLGDVEIFPTDLARTSATIAAFTRAVTASGAFPLILGGDHYVTFPCVQGFLAAVSDTRPGARVGYVHLDNHLDMFDDNPVWGPVYHGSTVRRVSELPGLDPANMLLVGQTGLAGRETWDYLHTRGIRLVTLGEVRRRGMTAALDEALADLCRHVDLLYVSIDIDVVACAYAPGTGGIVLDGLEARQLFEAVSVFARHPVAALDLAEVSPNYDPAETTIRLAAQALFQFLVERDSAAGEP
jgi:agmatinase